MINVKIRIISSKEDLETLHHNEEIIHVAFRPSNTNIFEIVIKCPNLKAIHMPNSYKKTLSKSSEMFLGMQNIKLLEGDLDGNTDSIETYSEISQYIYDKIAQLRLKGITDTEIIKEMRSETTLSPDILSFIIRRNSS